MRMLGRFCGIWFGAATLSLVAAGCSDASKQRWNDFWGLDQPEARRPVVKGRRDRDAEARPKKVARRDPPAPAKESGRADARSDEVERKVDDYVATMPPRGGEAPVGDDLNSKIARQEDPNRHRRIRNAAATRSATPESEGEGVALRRSEPAGSTAPGGVSGPGGRPVVQTASLDKPPPVAAESRLPQSPTDEAEERSIGRIPDRGKPGEDDTGRPVDRSGSEASDAEDGVEAPVLKEVTVTGAPEPASAEKAPPRRSAGPVANEPVPEMVTPRDSFAADLAKQAALVREDPNNIEEQYRLRMMYLIHGEDAKALEPVEGIDADIQEIIQAQIRALISARSSSGRDPATWANRQLASIEELRQRMRARADIVIPKVVLCTAIEGFGRYEPIEPAEFPAGRKNLVLVYIEVDNFTSPKTETGMYRTLLSVRQHLLTRDGQEMWSKRDENIEDLARQQRRDFYLTIGPIAIPKALPPGEYTLKVEVEDMQAGKLNSSVAEFRIVP